MNSELKIPKLALVVLVGPSGAGKSTFAAKHFLPSEVVSSDRCRGIVADDENAQDATGDAFDLLHYICAKRLKRGLLTVVDATNVRPEDRRHLVMLAREYHCLPVAIVLDVPARVCEERNAGREDREFGSHVIRRQRSTMRRGIGKRGKGLRREGFRVTYHLDSPEAVDAASIRREPLWNDRSGESGPFDIIGDVHGCFDELVELVEKLGWKVERSAGAAEGDWPVTPPPAGDGPVRRLLFLGDLVDRGPKSPAALRFAMRQVADGHALCVPGNHEIKLLKKLQGRQVQLTHGLAETMEQLESEPPEFLPAVAEFIEGLISHYVLDGGKLVVSHAGLREEMQGRGSGAVRQFCLYGETTGEIDDFGLPVRYDWAAEYRGRAMVVYGHTPVPQADWLNGTICIDTGCVFGGKMTALRYPERELIDVDAHRMHYAPVRPLIPDQEDGRTAQQQHDDMLDLDDVRGKRIVDTRLQRNLTIHEANATAALEAMSRFAADPRWLIHLPPTMSPCETSPREGLLEHPDEAFAYYRDRGVAEVVCEEKHMGSRAIVVVCRDAETARERFGVDTGEIGIVVSRTGRRFFDDAALEAGLLARLRDAAEHAGLWQELESGWMCLDAELMPWSAKAQMLLREQYAAVGAAARSGLAASVAALQEVDARLGGDTTADLLQSYGAREAAAARFTEAYRHYCWEVAGLDDLRLAPFHLLASEGQSHVDRDHSWHMSTLARLAESDPLLMATAWRKVSLSDAGDIADAVAWWEDLTGRGGEGMVVKPHDFVVRGRRGLLQPAVKCRGPEYLRIIYGPDYLEPANLVRLKKRGLKLKRSLALREFALGVESLERFVRGEPLRRVHECVFGVLALESEPVDPRL